MATPCPGLRSLQLLIAAGVVFASGGCGHRLQQVQLAGAPATVSELWEEPVDLAARDLFHGPGELQLRPRDSAYTFISQDKSGWSPGFDVRSADGIKWSVKLGPEAQSEVVSSRILWAVGFHQPAAYYVERWTMQGEQAGPQPAGRFRPEVPGHEVLGDWSWYENPFIGTRPYGGLVVANLILNSWDWKTSNNKIYRVRTPSGGTTRRFVVRDLGASLGKQTYPSVLRWFRLRGFGQGTRNDIDGFEAQGFIERVERDSTITFDYRGIYRDVIESVKLADVRWTCELLSRLSDVQWADAFRAGGYNPDQTGRYVKKIKEKIAQGIALTSPAASPGR